MSKVSTKRASLLKCWKSMLSTEAGVGGGTLANTLGSRNGPPTPTICRSVFFGGHCPKNNDGFLLGSPGYQHQKGHPQSKTRSYRELALATSNNKSNPTEQRWERKASVPAAAKSKSCTEQHTTLFQIFGFFLPGKINFQQPGCTCASLQ